MDETSLHVCFAKCILHSELKPMIQAVNNKSQGISFLKSAAMLHLTPRFTAAPSTHKQAIRL